MPNELHKTAKQLVSPGKGILASDESETSANKSLSKNDIEPTEENRRRYREVFINTSGIDKYLNGIILSEETFTQRDSKDKPFRETLIEQGILVGVKVDGGTTDLPGFPGEKYTQGLDNLSGRLKEFYDEGARFAKWRTITKIGKNTPTERGNHANAHSLALYAAICQHENIVPIVEPEVLLEGNHTIEESFKVTKQLLKAVFDELEKYKVDLEGLVLKTSMVLPGEDSGQEADAVEVAAATVSCLKQSVPKEVAGVVFLSGGQEPNEATRHLNAIAKLEPLPWEISFSFLRAIEGPALETWAGKDENVEKAREVFVQMLENNALADQGRFGKQP